MAVIVQRCEGRDLSVQSLQFSKSKWKFWLILLVFLVGLSYASAAQQPEPGQVQRAQNQQTQDLRGQDQRIQDQPNRDQSHAGPQQKDNPAEEKYYQRWLDEDVHWIITDEERAAFNKLSTAADRDRFIEAFWQRRDPTPNTPENEYKEEHYRRIAYSNEHFSSRDVPGWRADRGRVYITYGKPDSVDSHPMGGPYQRTPEEGGGITNTYPFQVWRYRYLEGIGQEIEIEFVDTCSCGEYHMTLDSTQKDRLTHIPIGPTPETEPAGQIKLDLLRIKPPDRLPQSARLNAAPEVKFKDLEAVINTKIRYNLLPFDVRVDFVRVTTDTVLVPITIQAPNRELTFVVKNGVQRSEVHIFGRLTTLTGKVAQTFEDTRRLDIPAELFDKFINYVALYQKALLLRPGRYRLDIVFKDVNGDKLGTVGQSLIVPEFSEGMLTSSTLILADVLEPVPSREVGTGEFILGTNKVRPRVAPADGKPTVFRRDHDQKVNFWMQVYGLAPDKKTKQPSATVEYQIINTTSNRPIVDITENTDQMGNVGNQVTLSKSLPLNRLEPGVYQVTIKIIDLISKQTISPTAKFAVE